MIKIDSTIGILFRGILLTLLSILLHLAPFNTSMLTMDYGSGEPDGILGKAYISYAIEVHRNIEPAFAKRPLTTWSIEGLNTLGLDEYWAFVTHSFLFIFLCGCLVYGLAIKLGASVKEASVAQAIFHVLPTVMFAFFIPVYTYDEPLQYFFILLTLYGLLCRRSILAIVSLSLALIARETTIILFPALLMVGIQQFGGQFRKALGKMFVMLGIPILLYAIFLFFYIPYRGLEDASSKDFASRLQFFNENFKNAEMAGESLSFLYLSIGLSIFLIATYAIRGDLSKVNRVLVRGFLLTMFLNTLVILLATKAREARLFFLPVLLISPLLGRAWLRDLNRMGGMKGYFKIRAYWPGMLLFLFGASILVLFSDHVFRLSDGVGSRNLHHEYFLAQSLFILLNVLNTAYMYKIKISSAKFRL